MADVPAQLAALDPLERDLLVVLALGSESGLLEGQWLRAADRAGVTALCTPRLDDPAMHALARSLRERKVLLDQPVEQPQLLPERWIAPLLADAVARERLLPIANRLAESSANGAKPGSLGRLGDARIALAQGRFDLFDFAIKRTLWSRSEPESDPVWVQVLGLHPSAEWLRTVGPRYRSYYLRGALDRVFLDLTCPSDAVFAAARETAADEPEIAARLAAVFALRGGHDDEVRALTADPSHHVQYARGLGALTRHEIDAARRDLAFAVRPARALPLLVPFVLLLGLTDPNADVALLKEALDKLARKPSPWAFALATLTDFAALRAGRERPATIATPRGSWLNTLFPALVARYRDTTPSFEIRPMQRHAAREGFGWIADQLAEIERREPRADSLLGLWRRREPWELALEALKPAVREESTDWTDGELVWEVRPSTWDDSLGVTPRWCKPGPSRRGKELPLSRFESGEIAPDDPRDRAIVVALVSARQKRVRLGRRQLALFVGHPRLISSSGTPVRVEERAARLVVQNDGTEAMLALDPPAFDDTGALVLEAPDVLTLVQQTPETERIAKILGGSSLRVPARGLDRLGELLESLGPNVVVHTVGALKQAEETGDARIHVQLTRSVVKHVVASGSAAKTGVPPQIVDGVYVRFRVVPREGGPELEPGLPPEVLVAPTGSTLGSIRRNLAGERRALEAIHERCPSLARAEPDRDELRADLETALELLTELSDLATTDSFPRIVVSWRSTPLRLGKVGANAKQIRFALRGNTRWLAVEGEATLNDGRVIPMRQLLEAMDHARGRFVPVGTDDFVELEAGLREALQNLALARRLGARGQIPLAMAPAIEAWTEGFERTWDATTDARRRAAKATPPRLPPAALQAALRDYQLEGFEFLARRADAGRGAILADDMGLGKTVQTLALLLARSERGAGLVIAPTSVLHNWENEIRRFAPTLRVRRLTNLDAAGPGDLVLTSYGLLVQHAERLAGRTWSTLVFDEAHALKNPATLRWKAARSLSAEACVALTGTPVENHVGELHALFDIVEPGLLGSRVTFRRMIAIPMARGEARPASMLRRIVRPVILRRTKTEVLTELPPKTEMVQMVTASSEHRAFYEAVRLRAVDRVRATKENQHPSGKARIELLAEITRLRRAAIDPRLVGGPSAPPGSKFDALVHVVRELREEGHRALIFSQFLEVLDFARDRLETDGVRCLRLDGTMPASARATVIAGFQAGEGDVLLASLKAGGVGVNLTAADFVVHLDPWWNPAVEDQATDRTHRFGQQRPVTVLRLCTEHTIEEKVLALHADKRRLYDDVVGEADGAPQRFDRPDELEAALSELLE